MNQEAERFESFTYTLSHELKEPVNEIEAYLQLIEEDNREILSEESLSYLRSAMDVCGALRDLIKNMVSYSKSQYREINPECFSVEELITRRWKSITAMGKYHCSLEMSKLPCLKTDVFLFQEVVDNILSNSLKYSSQVDAPAVRVFSTADRENVCLYFADNGIGFDTRYADQAFLLFKRLHNGKQIDGNGIGLATVKRIVERLRGEVDIYGKPNQGCTVTLKLPVSMLVSGEEQKQEQKEIRIGILEDASGVYADYNTSIHAAYAQAASEINEAGGIHGRPVRLVYKDYRSDLALAASAARELVEEDHVDVLMGGFLSSHREVIREIVDEKRILYFYNIVYEGGVADHYTFCTGMLPEQNIFPLLQKMSEEYGKSCYVIVPDYIWGFIIVERVKEYAYRHGMVIKGIEYLPVNKTNLRVTIENILETDPDMLLDFCFGTPQRCFYEQWAKAGDPEMPILSTYGIPVCHLHKETPALDLHSLHFMSSFLQDSQTGREGKFCRKLRQQSPELSTSYIISEAEPAYSALFLYKKAVELADSSETEDVIHALESGEISFDGPGGPVTIRGEDHQTIRSVSEYRVGKGQEILCTDHVGPLYSTYTEQVIRKKTGISGGLKSLGINAPGEQLNPMFNKL